MTLKNIECHDKRIFNIFDFATFDIEIDFNNLETASKLLKEITDSVSTECPVGKFFGVSGKGEGVVWIRPGTTSDRSMSFKTKCDDLMPTKKSSVSYKDPIPENMVELLDNTVTKVRLEQGISYIIEMHNSISKEYTEEFIQWIIKDIFKEEADMLKPFKNVFKDLKRNISKRATLYFMNMLKKPELDATK